MLSLLVVVAALPVLVAAQAHPAITASPKLRRQYQDICDPVSSVFVCDRGTCYWGDDGFVGCCSVSRCAPRTTCIENAELSTASPCDHNTGGCVICSRPEAPYCVTNTNVAMGHYAMYCNNVRFTNTYSHTYSWPGLDKTTTALESPDIVESEGPSSSADRDVSPLTSGTMDTRAPETSIHNYASVTATSLDFARSGTGSNGGVATPTGPPGQGSGGQDDSGEDDSGSGSSGSRDSGTWAIVGGALGGAIVIAIVLALWWRWSRKRALSVTTPSTTQPMVFRNSRASPPNLQPSPLPSSRFQPSPTSPHHFAPYAPSSIVGYTGEFQTGGAPPRVPVQLSHPYQQYFPGHPNESGDATQELPDHGQEPARHELGGSGQTFSQPWPAQPEAGPGRYRHP